VAATIAIPHFADRCVSRRLCDRMYDARSDWVHGSHVALFARKKDQPGGPETDEQREV
jgi:hypothetical protein